MKGWVYFAQDGDRTKIGWTTGPIEKRMRELRTGAPLIEVVHVISTDDRSLERDLHKLFKDYRIAGEWFALPDDWRQLLPEPYQEKCSRVELANGGLWNSSSLLGSWFLSFTDEGYTEWQGCVVADLGDGLHLVETYSWLDGCNYEQRIISVDEMRSWRFYDTNQQMIDAYNITHKHNDRHPPLADKYYTS